VYLEPSRTSIVPQHLAVILPANKMAPSIDPELTIRMLIVGTAPAFELPPA
jgi:hypothetical protein